MVTGEIEAELKRNHFKKYSSYNTLPGYFIASPLRLTDKSYRTEKREFHLGSTQPEEGKKRGKKVAEW